jgi:hypothetical protein
MRKISSKNINVVYVIQYNREYLLISEISIKAVNHREQRKFKISENFDLIISTMKLMSINNKTR